jgi:predicted DCC family thiol-disulfide oxidoreductase YuxK
MTEAEHVALAGRSILLYDGVCGLCNRLVQLFLRIDRSGILRFTPLESPFALDLLTRFAVPQAEPEGVILITGTLTPHEAIYHRFDAIREALCQLHDPWSTLGALLRFVPRSLREWSYGVVARNRYRLFGKYDTCPIPTEAQRSRILGM